jgi:hypothetical protein
MASSPKIRPNPATMTYKQLSGLIRATLTKEQEDKEVEIRIGDNSYSNLYLVSTEEDLFLNPNQPEPVHKTP